MNGVFLWLLLTFLALFGVPLLAYLIAKMVTLGALRGRERFENNHQYEREDRGNGEQT